MLPENPYQGCAAPPESYDLAPDDEPVEPFVSAAPRAALLMLLFALLSIVSVLLAGVNLIDLQLLHRERLGLWVSMEGWELLGLIGRMLARTYVLLIVLTSVAYLMWLHRAYRNLPALGARGLKHSPRSAVLWWVCPVAHIFMPYLVVSEVWRASNPESYRHPHGWRHAPTSWALAFWWAAWLAIQTAPRFVTMLYRSAESTLDYEWVDIAAIIRWGIVFLACILAAIVVRRIDEFQRRGDPAARRPTKSVDAQLGHE